MGDIVFKIITSIGTLGAIIFSGLAFVRSGRKDTEDKIYQLKVEAYKELIEAALSFAVQTVNLVSDVCTSTKKIDLSNTNQLDDLLLFRKPFQKHLVILPEKIMNLWFEIDENYQKVYESLKKFDPKSNDRRAMFDELKKEAMHAALKVNDFINATRKDILVEDLDKSLAQRLKKTDYLKKILKTMKDNATIPINREL